MKFTDGFWYLQPGVTAHYAAQAYDIEERSGSLVITATTKNVETRGDTPNLPIITATIFAPLPGVIGVRLEHFQGGSRPKGFALIEVPDSRIDVDGQATTLVSGDLSATIRNGVAWELNFSVGGRLLTSSSHKSVGYFTTNEDSFTMQQLSLAVGELVYGLGERFGPLVKNGQTIDIWNSDGGTSSEKAYKNVPFYLTNRGYGVLVNDSGPVSFEVGSESVERVQFSAPGESLEYYVIAGENPKEILERYTALTGRPASVPAWSYGLWLSTSFTTRYDEATVMSFIDGMAERKLPLSVFHFDCFWMREFNWTDFAWDARTFPDPVGMLKRIHDKGLRVCVWINPYIAQRSPLFGEAKELGYLLKRPNGDVWQWDVWQAGMGLVDFTNPEATKWYQAKLRVLLDQGVDAFKTDFGERIPLDVEYFDHSDPERMHNFYTMLYNQAVFDVLEDVRGKGEAVLFARSATVGGQRLPVHWGGDSTSTYESMAETLRGGLSLAMSGFGFWSHDIGGFEGTPDTGVFKRWLAFGLLSSHSRLHGSDSYRVPWHFDDEAVEVTRTFANLKMRLMPYLYAAGLEAHTVGTPVVRPMQLEFPFDPGAEYLDRQYMLGRELLVAPVFDPDGWVDFYLPTGTWTNYFTGEQKQGPNWVREQHGFQSLPLYVREGAVLPIGAVDDRPDYNYLDDLTLQIFPNQTSASRTLTVSTPSGELAEYVLDYSAEGMSLSSTTSAPWSACFWGRQPTRATGGTVELLH